MTTLPVRRGLVLPATLVVLVLLTAMVYQLNDSMLSAATNAARHAEAARAEAAAISGLRYAAAGLRRIPDRDAREKEVAIALSGAFQELPTPGDPRCGFRILGRDPESRYPAIDDESAKLNVNALPLDADMAVRAREILLALPHMTPQLADAVLDWIDADDQPREFGAERSYYFSAGTGLPRNGRLESLEELLQVRGVTPELFYGRARERNLFASRSGPREETSAWSDLLTIRGRESNLCDDGSPKIYLNQTDCATLYDELLKKFDGRTALFLAALRRYGPLDDATEPEELTDEQKRRLAERRAARQRGELVEDEDDSSGGSSRMRAGLELGGRAGYVVRSWADVCGARVRARINDVDEVLLSPWTADQEGLRRADAALTPHVTPLAGVAIEGRINVTAAATPVLMTLPGMTIDVARAISAQGRQVREEGREVRDPAWLLDRGFADWKTLVNWLPLTTLRGDVVTVRAEGVAGEGRLRTVLKAHLHTASQDIEILERRIGADHSAVDSP